MQPRLPHQLLTQATKTLARTQQTTRAVLAFQPLRTLSISAPFRERSQDTRPGWEGRHGKDHVLNRDGLDVQSDASIKARDDKAAAAQDPESKEGGQAVHEKDDGDHNKRAKEEHPEAPEPVIGMNSERGSKGH